jgi:hypothetical protein
MDNLGIRRFLTYDFAVFMAVYTENGTMSVLVTMCRQTIFRFDDMIYTILVIAMDHHVNLTTCRLT